MKHLILLAAFFTLTSVGFSQTMKSYSVSGGLLGNVNFTQFQIGGDNLNDIEYKSKRGWTLGAYLNLPLSDHISLEPQLLYSIYNYQAEQDIALLPKGSLTYFSVPILLKLHLGEDFAFTFGPQMDFLMDINNARFDIEKDFFSSTSFGLSGGIEIFPHNNIVLFARYIHGMSDLDALVTDDDAEYNNTSIHAGIKLGLFGVKALDTDGDGIADRNDKCPTVAGLELFEGCPDTDNDGITDASDECPSVAGLVKYNGCPIPDTDNDGINDEVDKCISVAGIAKYQGCPIPDTDADGVNDEMDKCPAVAGSAKYEGCPVPDTDADGINDENDKCPTVPGPAEFMGCPNPDRDNDGVLNVNDLCPDIKGPASNDGCPVVESAKFNARMINFKTGSAELTAPSKRDLKEGAALMNSSAFDNLVFHIHGHTDSDGSDEFNHKLSHRRAASVRSELIKNGVPADRMMSEGFGESKPIADNNTADGKALNRRVEILARHSQKLDEPVIVPKN